MKQKQKTTVGRRDFLRVLGAGAAAASAAPLVAIPAVAVESDADKKKARYRESDEVKTFYRVNRYPS